MQSILVSVWVSVIIAVAAAIVAGVAGFVSGGLHRKRVAEATIGSAQKEATRIVNEAVSKAESIKKEKILEAKDEIHKQRSSVRGISSF